MTQILPWHEPHPGARVTRRRHDWLEKGTHVQFRLQQGPDHAHRVGQIKQAGTNAEEADPKARQDSKLEMGNLVLPLWCLQPAPYYSKLEYGGP